MQAKGDKVFEYFFVIINDNEEALFHHYRSSRAACCRSLALKRTNERASEQTNEPTNERLSKRVNNERTNSLCDSINMYCTRPDKVVSRKAYEVTSVLFFFQRERVLKMRMKEKKLAKQKMANAEHKVRVATAFRGNRETDLDLQVGDEVTVIVKVRLCSVYPQGLLFTVHSVLMFSTKVFVCGQGDKFLLKHQEFFIYSCPTRE